MYANGAKDAHTGFTPYVRPAEQTVIGAHGAAVCLPAVAGADAVDDGVIPGVLGTAFVRDTAHVGDPGEVSAVILELFCGLLSGKADAAEGGKGHDRCQKQRDQFLCAVPSAKIRKDISLYGFLSNQEAEAIAVAVFYNDRMGAQNAFLLLCTVFKNTKSFLRCR